MKRMCKFVFVLGKSFKDSFLQHSTWKFHLRVHNFFDLINQQRPTESETKREARINRTSLRKSENLVWNSWKKSLSFSSWKIYKYLHSQKKQKMYSKWTWREEKHFSSNIYTPLKYKKFHDCGKASLRKKKHRTWLMMITSAWTQSGDEKNEKVIKQHFRRKNGTWSNDADTKKHRKVLDGMSKVACVLRYTESLHLS